MPKPATVDDYLAGLPPEQRAVLKQVRAILRSAAPEAVEVISYAIPGLRLGGRLLISYSAFARHWSLFPASGAIMASMGQELAPYFEPKATLRFAWDAPVPADLVRRAVGLRVTEFSVGA